MLTIHKIRKNSHMGQKNRSDRVLDISVLTGAADGSYVTSAIFSGR